jgi:hypothetical protein
MNNLLVWQEIVEIGTNPNILSCRKICFESIFDYTSKARVDFERYSNIPKEIPMSIIQIIGRDSMEKICSNTDGYIDFFNDDEYLINKKKILESNFCCCVHFEMERIIKEILNSYLVDKSLDHMDNDAKNRILEQFDIDFPRMILCYDSIRCNSISEFKTKIEKFDKFGHIVTYTLYYLIVMLCTQASFYYPFSILHNIYTLHDIGIHILPDEDYPFVNIIDNKTHLNIIFKKVMKYFDINTQKIITKIHTFMIIRIEMEEEANGYIFYGKKYVKNSSGSLYWVKENNLIVI